MLKKLQNTSDNFLKSTNELGTYLARFWDLFSEAPKKILVFFFYEKNGEFEIKNP